MIVGKMGCEGQWTVLSFSADFSRVRGAKPHLVIANLKSVCFNEFDRKETKISNFMSEQTT
jgi:hypothetical protein